CVGGGAGGRFRPAAAGGIAAGVLHRAAPPHRRRRTVAGVGAGGRGRAYRQPSSLPQPGRYTACVSIERSPLTTAAQVIKTSLPTPPPSVEALLKAVHDGLEELKAKDIVEIDVRGKSSVCD